MWQHGTDFKLFFREWSLCEDLVDERPQFDGSDRLAHGTAADLNDNLGTDIDVVVKSGMIGHLDDFRVGRRHGGDVHGHRKRILGNAVPDELFRQVILQPFPDKRAGGTAQFVAYLSLRQLSVETKIFTVYGNVGILGHSADEMPALAQIGTALEGDMLRIGQSEQCPQDCRHPPVFLDYLKVQPVLGLHTAYDFLSVFYG